MAFENTYNTDIAKDMVLAEDKEKFLDEEFKKIKTRMLSLDKAREKMGKGYELVLQGLKDAFPQLDLNDPNIKDSPSRMARALIELCSGLGIDDKEIFSTTFPAENYNQVVILRDIKFTSLCSHHFIPFKGAAHVGYLPDVVPGHDGRVVGLSKLARIVDSHAQRPQLQERLSYNIMNSIKKEIRPAGVMVVVEGKHGCLNCRGARKEDASMITSALSGQFKEDSKLREEFLALINHDK